MTKVTVKTVPTSPVGPAADVVASMPAPMPEAAGASELTKPTLKEHPAEKLFPVRMLRGYRPIGKFVMRPRIDPENEFSPRHDREPTPDEMLKVKAGYYCSLPLDEAKAIIAKGIAIRDDPMEV